jgi:hypothetical protein
MYKCKYCGKEFETSQKLNGHVGWCEMNPNKRDKSVLNHTRSAIKNTSSKLKGVEVACQYCGKLCKLYGLKNHERTCKMNPNRVPQRGTHSKLTGHIYVAWNKGLNKETDERVRKNAEAVSNSYKSGKCKVWCDGLTKENDERLAKMSKNISDTVNDKVANEEWHSSLGKVHHYECNGYTMHGKWELALAEYLNKKKISWERCKDKFRYYFEEAWHYYHPDIYLPDYDLYIEVKGCITEKDIAKVTDGGVVRYMIGPFGKEDEANALATAIRAVSDKQTTVEKVD